VNASIRSSGIAAVIFDLDDTLYSEHMFVDGGFRAVARFLAAESGEAEDDITERLWALHGRDGRGRLFDTLLRDLGLDADDEAVLMCVLVYRTHSPRLEAGPAVLDTLRRLRAARVRIGLLSDGMASVQRRKLEALPEVAALMDAVVMTDELGPGHGKPSSVGYLIACRLLRVTPAEAAYVGNDPRKDFAGARLAGLLTVRVGEPPDEGGPERMRISDWSDADMTLDGFGMLAEALSIGSTPRRSCP
jgi:putative hydrolase of the HAD superfamily